MALDRLGSDLSSITAIRGLWAPTGGELDKHFECVLPGHNGRATLHVDTRSDVDLRAAKQPRRDVWKYACWCCGEPAKYFHLPEVLASRFAGKVTRLKGPALLTWWRRLGFEVGVVTPLHVDLRQVDPGEAEHVHKTAAGFALLLGLRWLDHPNTPAPYGRSFVGPWCQLGRTTAGLGIRRLRELQVIERVGCDESGRWEIPLYLPSGFEVGIQ